MTLTNKEYGAFLRTHLELLFYVGKQMKVISLETPFNDFLNLHLTIKAKCRDILLQNENLLDDYLSINFERLSTDQIKILTGFKRKITSDFVIYKCLTNKAIFLDPKDIKFYAVKALGDRFDNFFERLPVLVNTTILPFNNQIIYDGFIKPSGVYFGPGMTSSIKEDYKKAKENKEIVTML